MAAPMRLRTAVLIMLALVVGAVVLLVYPPTTATTAPVVDAVAPATPTHETYVIPPRDTRNEAQCRAAAHRIGLTQDYLGTATERACFGEEDDWRVGLALDYGMTELEYAEAEAADM